MGFRNRHIPRAPRTELARGRARGAPRRNRTWIGLAALWLCAAARLPAADEAWHEIKTRHFLIYHAGQPEFARAVGRAAETDYDRIARQLGFTRHDNFWLWERRARIYIYRTRADFMQATGAPGWADGKAEIASRRIVTYQGSATFVDSVLPHELAHLIFADFMGLDRQIPLWLNEGVAQWMDTLRRDQALRIARLLHARRKLVPLQRLLRVQALENATDGSAIAFYAQSVSLVGFLIEQYGSARFRTFCGALRDGRSVPEALQFTYPARLRSIESLEQEWHRYLEEQR